MNTTTPPSGARGLRARVCSSPRTHLPAAAPGQAEAHGLPTPLGLIASLGLAATLSLTGCGDAPQANTNSDMGTGSAESEHDGYGTASLHLGDLRVEDVEARITTNLRGTSAPFEFLFEARIPPADLFPGSTWALDDRPLQLSVQLYLGEWKANEFELLQSLSRVREAGGSSANASLFVSDGTFDADSWPLPKRTVREGALTITDVHVQSDEAGRTWADGLTGVLTGTIQVPGASGSPAEQRSLRLEFEF